MKWLNTTDNNSPKKGCRQADGRSKYLSRKLYRMIKNNHMLCLLVITTILVYKKHSRIGVKE